MPSVFLNSNLIWLIRGLEGASCQISLGTQIPDVFLDVANDLKWENSSLFLLALKSNMLLLGSSSSNTFAIIL